MNRRVTNECIPLTEWASSAALLPVKQIAESMGFKGDFRQWEELLRNGDSDEQSDGAPSGQRRTQKPFRKSRTPCDTARSDQAFFRCPYVAVIKILRSVPCLSLDQPSGAFLRPTVAQRAACPISGKPSASNPRSRSRHQSGESFASSFAIRFRPLLALRRRHLRLLECVWFRLTLQVVLMANRHTRHRQLFNFRAIAILHDKCTGTHSSRNSAKFGRTPGNCCPNSRPASTTSLRLTSTGRGGNFNPPWAIENCSLIQGSAMTLISKPTAELPNIAPVNTEKAV